MMDSYSIKWSLKLKIGVICTVIDGILSGYNYFVIFGIIRMLYTANVTMAEINHLLTGLIIVYGIRLLIYGFGYTQSQIGGAKVSHDIRMNLGNKLRSIPLAKFQTSDTGDYINVTLNDVSSYEQILTHKVGELAKNMTLLVMILGFATIIFPKAGIILIIGTLFLIPALWISFYMVKKYGTQKNKVSAEAVSDIVEYITGIQVFRAYGAAGTRNKTVTEGLKRYSTINYVYEKKMIPISTCLNLIHGMTFPIVWFLSYRAFVSGRLDAVSFLLEAMLPVIYIKLCSMVFITLTSYKNLKISQGKINSIFAIESETENSDEFKPVEYDIEFNNVNFEYIEGEPVLKDVTFTAEYNQFVAIVGDSGSGKSTILNLIAKYYKPKSGEISIGGINTRPIKAEKLFDSISLLDQDIFLFNDTIKNNIRYANQNSSDEDIIRACKEANCQEFIEKLEQGYDTMLSENGSNLSGGERQRLSIARAILRDKPIILLDEATASLDIENELLVKQAIVNLLKKNKTVIMIAHTLSVVKNADKIIVVSDGHIVEQGTHDQLLSNNGKYASMWKADVELNMA